MKKILLWIGSIFMILSAIVCFPSVASLFMLMSGVVLLPLSAITKHYRRIIPAKSIRICLAIVLIVVSFLLTPVENVNNATGNDYGDSDTTITKSLETELQETISQEPEPQKSESQETESQENEPQEPNEPEISTFSIHFIDVGQADAALIECDGHYMLIDGGNKGDSNVIYTVLKNKNVSKLDMVVATHGHEDHIGGIPGAFNYTSSDITLCPINEYDTDVFNDFKKYATSKGGGITVPSVGNTYMLGSAEIKILGVNSISDANNSSIVLMITYGETKFLFTGDAEREAEQTILNSGVCLSATVLKVGHHGSETSTTYPFLREIMPEYAVISVGEGNSYGHPDEDTLSRLRNADVTVYRTDIHGDIYCTSDGKNIVFSVEKNESADTLTNQEETINTEQTPSESSEQNTDNNDYALNTKSKKFHYPSCSKGPTKNKEYFTGTRDELIAQGYSPCGSCNP
ncbi:MAG: MBL fold metallo-hydrolase [Clostridia bacterium]|nr:MBL fold metallo-hydrolase [Clostridia bacterium]